MCLLGMVGSMTLVPDAVTAQIMVVVGAGGPIGAG